MSLFAPVTALVVGWIGAALGARLSWRELRRIPARFYALAGLAGLAALGATAVGAVLLARWIPAAGAAWRPRIPAVLCLAAVAAVSSPAAVALVGRAAGIRRARLRLFQLAALADTALGALAFTLALGAGHPMGRGVLAWAVWLVVLAGGGALIALLFLSLARETPSDTEMGLYLLGLVLLGSGLGFAAGLSPFLVCLIAAAVVANFTPFATHPALHRRARRLLVAWEGPAFGAALVLGAGLLMLRGDTWRNGPGGGAVLAAAAAGLGTLRILAKWATVRLGRFPLGIRDLPPNAGLALSTPAGAAVAFGIGFLLAFGRSAPVLLTVFFMMLPSLIFQPPWRPPGPAPSPPSRSR